MKIAIGASAFGSRGASKLMSGTTRPQFPLKLRAALVGGRCMPFMGGRD